MIIIKAGRVASLCCCTHFFSLYTISVVLFSTACVMPGYTEPGGAFPAVPANQTFPSQDDTIQNLKVHR